MLTERCVGCGAELTAVEGPTHRYLESSPSCWAVYGEVLAREYSDFELMGVHKLTVDAYAVQHPGRPSPQTIQSAGVHLIRLYLIFERGFPPERTDAVMRAAARHKSTFHWLEPPAGLGPLTAADVARAGSTQRHRDLVRQWAEQMWAVWAAHHETVRHWAERALELEPG